MHRKPRSLFLPLTLGLIFSVPFIGCSSNSSGGSGGSASGGKASGGSGSGGSGSGGSGSGGTSAKGGSAGNSAGGASAGGNGSGGSGNSGSGAGGTSAKGGAGGGSSGAGGSAGGTSAAGTGAGGSSPGGTGAGGSSPGGASGSNGCSTDDTISNFEDGGDPAILPGTGITGTWEMFHDTGSATQTMKVEATGDSTACHKYALHTTGSNWASYVGIGITNLAGGAKDTTLKVYPNTKNYTGIKFRAKVGASHPANSPVRFNISTPATEGTSSGGTCTDGTSSANKAALPCYQHVGRYLQDDYALSSSQWTDVTFCFDRDLYPLSLPSNLSNAQRDSIAANMLKVQFQFNQAKDWTVSSYPAQGIYTAINKTTPFDFWIDDISFFTGDCPTKPAFQSTGSPAKTFPQNKAPTGGSCALATNAAKYNNAISQIYARWKKTFLQTNKVVSPEQNNIVTSEAMGYGLMIAAALGDKDTFDSMYSYVKGKIANGLMGWKDGDSTSATDGDGDITYALYMAAAQWPSGSYKTDADAMAKAFGADISGDVIRGGNNFLTYFNPSYFAPAAYRKFGTSYASMISKTYGLINANVNGATAGLFTDWADPSTGAPLSSNDVKAQVNSGLGNNGADAVFGYDAARVPWRLGLDVCTGGSDGSAALGKIISFFATKYDNGDSIDLLKAGWLKKDGSVDPAGSKVDCQGSFIGPMGVAGMAAGGDNGNKFRDRAFRAILDIEDYGDFNHTYFPSTVGFLTLLLMSGNFPTP